MKNYFIIFIFSVILIILVFPIEGEFSIDKSFKSKNHNLYSSSVKIGSWKNMSPSQSPPSMDSFTGDMTYDSESNRIILFGGPYSADPQRVYDQTWAYDYVNNTWKNLTPTQTIKPESMGPPRLVYDSESDRVIALVYKVWYISSTSENTYFRTNRVKITPV